MSTSGLAAAAGQASLAQVAAEQRRDLAVMAGQVLCGEVGVAGLDRIPECLVMLRRVGHTHPAQRAGDLLSEPTDEEIKIVYTGLRPGEKLFEELLAHDEQTRPTPHPKLRIAKAREVDSGFINSVSAWLLQDRIPDDSDVRRDLKRWVPEYVAQVRPRLKSISGGAEKKLA